MDSSSFGRVGASRQGVNSMLASGNEMNELQNKAARENERGPISRLMFLANFIPEAKGFFERVCKDVSISRLNGVLLLSRFKNADDNNEKELLSELSVLKCWATKNKQELDAAIVWGTTDFNDAKYSADRVESEVNSTGALLFNISIAQDCLRSSDDGSLKEFCAELHKKVEEHYKNMGALLEKKKGN